MNLFFRIAIVEPPNTYGFKAPSHTSTFCCPAHRRCTARPVRRHLQLLIPIPLAFYLERDLSPHLIVEPPSLLTISSLSRRLLGRDLLPTFFFL